VSDLPMVVDEVAAARLRSPLATGGRRRRQIQSDTVLFDIRAFRKLIEAPRRCAQGSTSASGRSSKSRQASVNTCHSAGGNG